MKTYQPNNGPIKFVVVNSEYNDDHTYNKIIMDVFYTTTKDKLVYQHSTVGRKQPQSIDVPTKMSQEVDVHIGLLRIEKVTWKLSIGKTPYDTSLRSPYYVTNHTTINNTDYDFNKLLGDIADTIVQYYENNPTEPPNKEEINVKQDVPKKEDMTELPDALRERIKIDVYPHIKSVLLNVYVCYDGTSGKFHTKVETVRINGVTITDLQLDDVGFMELTAIYMHDALKRIDFTSAIENHLRMLNSRLDLCHKILNSNLES